MKKFTTWLFTVGLVILFTGLAFFSLLGYYNRYWSDDWCYNRDFKNLGVPSTISLYFATGEEADRGWSLNRYSQTILTGLSHLAGVAGTQALPVITISIWAVSLYWVISNLCKLSNYPLPSQIRWLLSLLILYLTLYISPDRFQVLYWRSGVIPYSYTILFGLIMAGLITDHGLGRRNLKTNSILIVLTGFIGGGFSETGSTYLLSTVTLALAAAWLGKRSHKPWAEGIFNPVLTAWVVLFIAFLAILLSPSNSRYESTERDLPSFYLVPFLALRAAFLFIWFSLKDLPLPHGVFTAAIAAVSIIYTNISGESRHWKPALWAIGIVGIITLILITAIQTPTTYLYNSPPDPRGQSLSRFTMLAGVAIMAWIFGMQGWNRFSKQAVILAAVVLSLSWLYMARAVTFTFDELPGFVVRAQIWDDRDSMIREQVANGAIRLEVPVIDTQAIGTKDIMRSRDMNNWVTNCASDYYGLKEIKAISP